MSIPEELMMTYTPPSRLLALPQELRDLVYEHALGGTLPWPAPRRTSWIQKESTLEPSRDSAASLTNYYPTRCPRPIWYTLLLCCKTTNKDIQDLLQTTALKQKTINIPPAIINLNLSSTTATATWQTIPCHPRQISSLHINVRLSQIYETCFTSGAPDVDNMIIRALFHLLRQYCQFGPHLSRKSPLSLELKLETLVLSMEPDFCVEQVPHFFANPAQQLATISGVLMIWLGRFARSGQLWEHVEKLKWNCKHIAEIEGETMEFKVTNNRWDEEDRETFEKLEYSWY